MLDLFSGVGCFSLAFRDTFTTVAYCENDLNCVAVLRRNMAKGKLQQAPILPDITKLKEDQVAPLHPALVTMGFPCQDISQAKAGAVGLQGPRSKLYREALRVISWLPSVKWVLLENSPNIVENGMPTILRALRALSFECSWGIFSASSAGAPHMRRRWFCLACRAPAPPLRTMPNFSWKREPRERLLGTDDPGQARRARLRCSMLGNAVVPQCVLLAYHELRSASGGPVAVGQSDIDLKLRFGRGRDLCRKQLWATPVHSLSTWSPSRVITPRGLRIIVNQLLFEHNTQRPLARHVVANPRFIEWMMGCCPDWTLT